MNDKFAVCIGKGGQRDQAESFARKTESIIAEMCIRDRRYKDGTVLTLDLTMGGIAGGGEKQDKENGVLIIRNSFPQLVDVDNLQAVHFGNIDQWLEVRE